MTAVASAVASGVAGAVAQVDRHRAEADRLRQNVILGQVSHHRPGIGATAVLTEDIMMWPHLFCPC